MRDMLHDVFLMHDLGPDPSLSQGGEAEGVYEDRQGTTEGAKKFYDLLNDADKPLYEGCTEYTKFIAIVDLYNLKCMARWSNSSFTSLLEKMNKMLPPNASLPKNTYEAKKYMRELGLGYEKISVDRNGCMLFWKDNENVETCKVCGKSKWKKNKDGAESSHKSKKKLIKVLQWFPLKSRLQRLFMSSKTTSHMKWHIEDCTNDGVLKHPANALAWEAFDSHYPNFASDSHNIRLGLATNVFNPSSDMSTCYNTWQLFWYRTIYLLGCA
ncbi:hypothetical protein SLA2020_431220 [Shorea laevis]